MMVIMMLQYKLSAFPFFSTSHLYTDIICDLGKGAHDNNDNEQKTNYWFSTQPSLRQRCSLTCKRHTWRSWPWTEETSQSMARDTWHRGEGGRGQWWGVGGSLWWGWWWSGRDHCCCHPPHHTPHPLYMGDCDSCMSGREITVSLGEYSRVTLKKKKKNYLNAQNAILLLSKHRKNIQH